MRCRAALVNAEIPSGESVESQCRDPRQRFRLPTLRRRPRSGWLPLRTVSTETRWRRGKGGVRRTGCDSARFPELIREPRDHGLAKHLPGTRIRLKDALQDPIELPKRFFEKDYIIEVAAPNASGFQAELNGVLGKPMIMLDPGKPLLFRGSQ